MAQPSLSFDPIDEARRHWEERWTEEAATEMVAVTSIMRVHQILIARLNEVLEPFGLTFPRYEALMLLFLSRRGSLPLGKIGERLQVHRTSVTNTVDGLEKLGLVRRVPHESDRRAVLAEIAPAGREIAEMQFTQRRIADIEQALRIEHLPRLPALDRKDGRLKVTGAARYAGLRPR